LSPALSSLAPALAVPDIAPTIPTNCFSISIFSSAWVILNTKNNAIIVDKIFFHPPKVPFFTTFSAWLDPY
jgi:hypothetical protein